MLNFEQAKEMAQHLMDIEEQTKEAEAVDFMETTFTKDLTEEITSGSYNFISIELPSYLEVERIKRLLDGNGYKGHYTINRGEIMVKLF